MLRPINLLIAISLFLGCSNNNQDIDLQRQLQTDSSAKAIPILFSGPRTIDSSHIVIYPLILERESYVKGFSSGGGDRTSYWNLIFYDTDNNSEHLLTTNKIIIYSFEFNGSSSLSSGEITANGINIYKNNILYNAVSNDFNQNKYLDSDDPSYLYVSDRAGNNFRQISPDNYNVISWEVVTGTSKIILLAQKDENGDKKFDPKDQVIPLIVDVASGKMATETFRQSYIDSIKNILSNTWKVEKK